MSDALSETERLLAAAQQSESSAEKLRLFRSVLEIDSNESRAKDGIAEIDQQIEVLLKDASDINDKAEQLLAYRSILEIDPNQEVAFDFVEKIEYEIKEKVKHAKQATTKREQLITWRAVLAIDPEQDEALAAVQQIVSEIETLIRSAEGSELDESKLAIFQAVLEIDPSNKTAIEEVERLRTAAFQTESDIDSNIRAIRRSILNPLGTNPFRDPFKLFGWFLLQPRTLRYYRSVHGQDALFYPTAYLSDMLKWSSATLFIWSILLLTAFYNFGSGEIDTLPLFPFAFTALGIGAIFAELLSIGFSGELKLGNVGPVARIVAGVSTIFFLILANQSLDLPWPILLLSFVVGLIIQFGIGDELPVGLIGIFAATLGMAVLFSQDEIMPVLILAALLIPLLGISDGLNLSEGVVERAGPGGAIVLGLGILALFGLFTTVSKVWIVGIALLYTAFAYLITIVLNYNIRYQKRSGFVMALSLVAIIGWAIWTGNFYQQLLN